jgi:hypothetical protein
MVNRLCALSCFLDTSCLVSVSNKLRTCREKAGVEVVTSRNGAKHTGGRWLVGKYVENTVCSCFA